MASNGLGTVFRFTTFGESHGPAIGVVVDGCPAGLALSSDEINAALARRSPGKSPWTSPRREPDQAEILSGVYEGATTGAPIALLIRNRDADPSAYHAMQHLLRPGHASFTYHRKYGIYDPFGGGRASARETACRVAAGAVAHKLLAYFGVAVVGFLQSVGGASCRPHFEEPELLRQAVGASRIFCPHPACEAAMIGEIEAVLAEGDSVGGVVGVVAFGLPPGLGDPVYEKLEAKLASAMLSIPATKGFEVGEGFGAATMRGSQHNDRFYADNGRAALQSNRAGGTLGGISTGMPLTLRVAFKPTSSIRQPQQTVDLQGDPAVLSLPAQARHDPCVAVRGVPVAEAMCALVVADCLLMNRLSRLDGST